MKDLFKLQTPKTLKDFFTETQNAKTEVRIGLLKIGLDESEKKLKIVDPIPKDGKMHSRRPRKRRFPLLFWKLSFLTELVETCKKSGEESQSEKYKAQTKQVLQENPKSYTWLREVNNEKEQKEVLFAKLRDMYQDTEAEYWLWDMEIGQYGGVNRIDELVEQGKENDYPAAFLYLLYVNAQLRESHQRGWDVLTAAQNRNTEAIYINALCKQQGDTIKLLCDFVEKKAFSQQYASELLGELIKNGKLDQASGQKIKICKGRIVTAESTIEIKR